MRVKKFTASTMAEAMRRVKEELGQDAVIVHTRECGRSFFGLFGRPYVEVTAGSGLGPGKRQSERDEPTEPNPLLSPPLPAQSIQDRVELSGAHAGRAATAPPELKALARSVLAKHGKTAEVQTPQEIHRETLDASAALDRRLGALEEQLNRLNGLIGRVLGEREAPASFSQPGPWQTFLRSQGVEDSLADEIVEALSGPVSCERLREELIRRLPVTGPIQPGGESTGPKVVMLVGPTGVGKTTTLAKIAPGFTHPRSGEQKKVVFMTADLFRIAAVEQLHKYSEILRVPLEVVYTPQEASSAIHKHKEADLILVDTGGTGQRNESQISNLAEIARACKPLEVHLVLSATTKNTDLVDILDRFNVLEPQHLLITKLDESTTFGNILNAVVRSKLPVSYLTTGQMVPEDIELATSERLADLILRDPASVERAASLSQEQVAERVTLSGGADHA